MEQIDRDVMRTHPDMHFFSGDGESSKQHREVCNTLIRILCWNNPANVCPFPVTERLIVQFEVQEIKRALFIYAKLNPGIKYVQGMNEIYAPIYYQFATDTDTDAAMHAEADAFFCFVELISEFRDHFCQHLVSKHFMQTCLPSTGFTCHMFHLHSCIS